MKLTRYEWVYLYAAVEPATGESVALLAPKVNTATSNVFLKMLAAEVKADEHVVLIMIRQAGTDSRRWNCRTALRYCCCRRTRRSNPTENLWHYLQSHHLSNRAYEDYDDLIDAGSAAWRTLTPEVIRSTCRCAYLERARVRCDPYQP